MNAADRATSFVRASVIVMARKLAVLLPLVTATLLATSLPVAAASSSDDPLATQMNAVRGPLFNQPVSSQNGRCISSVQDLNFPSGANVYPGQHIPKGWAFVLCGDGWPFASAVRVGGDFGPQQIPIEAARPGSTLRVYAPVYAPMTLGRHSARYQLAVDGHRFGPTFGLEITTTLYFPFRSQPPWRMTQGDHPAWQAGDGWNGKARDFAPRFGNCANETNLAASVLPAAPGRVILIDPRNATIAIDHLDGIISVYVHVYPVRVSLGELVSMNTILGSPSMHGGTATGCHVHLAFAKYSGAPRQPGQWDPNRGTWFRTFPALAQR